MKDHAFVIQGHITRPDGKTGVGGLLVDIYDRDLVFYEALGQYRTDRDGRFIARYEPEGLEAIFHRAPEVRLVVRDAAGRAIHRAEAGWACRSGSVVQCDASVSDAAADAHEALLRPVAPPASEALLSEHRVGAMVAAADALGPDRAAGLLAMRRIVARIPPLLRLPGLVPEAARALEGDPDAIASVRETLLLAEQSLRPEERPEEPATANDPALWDELQRRLTAASRRARPSGPPAVSKDAAMTVVAAIVLQVAADAEETQRFLAVLHNQLWRASRIAPLLNASADVRAGMAGATARLSTRLQLVGGRAMSGGFGGGLPTPDDLPGGGFPGGGLPGDVPGLPTPGDDERWWRPRPGGYEPGDDWCPSPWPWRWKRRIPIDTDDIDRWLCTIELLKQFAAARLRTSPYTISALVSPDACAGATLVIQGSGFGSVPSPVVFTAASGGTVDATPVSWTDTEIRVVVPTEATTGSLSLRIADGTVLACGRTYTVYRWATRPTTFLGGQTRVTALALAGGAGRVDPGTAISVAWATSNATTVQVVVTASSGETLWTATTSSGSGTVTLPAWTATRTVTALLTANGPCGTDTRSTSVTVQPAYDLAVQGIEVTQGIQYWRADQHLTDAADRGADNSVRLVQGKSACLRVYLRSGGLPGFNGGRLANVTGTVRVDRRVGGTWSAVGGLLNPNNGPVVAEDAWPSYDAERGALGATLNFIVPAATMNGMLRFTARVSSVDDATGRLATGTSQVTVDLQQTLRVAAVAFGYAGNNTATPPAAVAFAAPTAANVTNDLGWMLRAWPVGATPQVRVISTQNVTQPLNGVVPAGGCDPAWGPINNAVAAARTADGTQAGWLYYGFVTASIPRTHGNVGCASGGVASGLMGGGTTVAHELGHQTGLAHAPCGRVGAVNAAYPRYEPYDPWTTVVDAGGATVWNSASIGEYGLDVSTGTLLNPNPANPGSGKDFMSYCGTAWISLYTWNYMLNRASLNPVTTAAGAGGTGGMGMFDSQDRRRLITLIGGIDEEGRARVDHVWRALADMPDAPGRRTELVAELISGEGGVLARAPVFAMEGCAGTGCGCGGQGPERGFRFQAVLSEVAEGAALVVRRGEEVLWRRDRPESPASIEAVHATLARDGRLEVRWRAPGAVEAWVRGSIDGGATWRALAVGITEDGVSVDRAAIAADRVMLELVVHDGFDSTSLRLPDEVSLPPRPAVLGIVHPTDGSTLAAGTPLHLWGALLDAGSKAVEEGQAAWTLDGEEVARGTDAWIAPPAPGEHVLRLAVEGTEAAEVRFRVPGEPPAKRGKQ